MKFDLTVGVVSLALVGILAYLALMPYTVKPGLSVPDRLSVVGVSKIVIYDFNPLDKMNGQAGVVIR